MSKNTSGQRPGRAARGFSWALSALLALTLTAAVAGGMVLYMLHSAGMRERIASNETLLQKETEWASRKIRDLAEEYGFEADRVLPVLDREMLIRRNVACLEWISKTAVTGQPQGMIADDGEIEEKLSGLLRFPEIKDPEKLNRAYGDSVAAINRVIGDAAFFFRNDLTDVGLAKARNYADVHGFVNLIMKLPLILGILSAAVAGLIVLLIARDPRQALKYLGCSFGASGLLTGLGLVLLRWIDLPAAAAVANERLAVMLSLAQDRLFRLGAGVILLLLALYVLLTVLYIRRTRATEEGVIEA